MVKDYLEFFYVMMIFAFLIEPYPLEFLSPSDLND